MIPKTVADNPAQSGRNGPSPYTMAGLVSGTLIRSGDGDIPIEFLSPGDRLISRIHGMVTLNGIKVRHTTAKVVRIAPGALAPDIPKHATMMPATQSVFLRGARAKAVSNQSQAVVPAGNLVDGTSVCDLGMRPLTLIRLVFDRPEVIYADGIEVAINTLASELQKAA